MQGRIRPIPSPSKHPKKSHQILETPQNKRPQHIPLQSPQTPELSASKSPLCQLVLRLTDLTHTEISQLQDTHTLTHIRPTHIINTSTSPIGQHTTKNQHKLECYSALNREYTTASYLSTVSDVKLRKTLTMYRLSEHSLAVETGRRRRAHTHTVNTVWP